ncbi:protein rer1 [Anaeramoeba flamelloides]|uniref:Protein rer1 n=1 Tax=Anaeramoeba flamelloides TaxID=1746091 RepID=A0ABQ8YXL7_9EUKA|nr:protein rer1 [Anaeramoeba flamelloides]
MIKYRYVPFSFGKKKYSPKKHISTTSQYDLSGFGDEKTDNLNDANENEFGIGNGNILQPSINNSTISSSIDIKGSSDDSDFSIQRRVIDSNKNKQSNFKTTESTLSNNSLKNSDNLNLNNQELLSQNNEDQNKEKNIVQTKQFQNIIKTKKMD